MINNLYYLGPAGSFSQVIAGKINISADKTPCRNFSEIIKNVLNNKNTAGLLPIENSITSSVHENMDYLFKENLSIIAEAYLKIKMSLIGLPDSEINSITKVYSHPQALAQCKQFILKHNLQTFETDSTSSAKNHLLKSGDVHTGLIGGRELAEGSMLKILNEDISDEKYNITRFLIISTEPVKILPGLKNKASIMMKLHHKPGSLASALTALAEADFNLTKIESRPIPTTSWEYQFWIDFCNDNNNGIDIDKLIEVLQKNTKSFKIIGLYSSGNIYE